MRNFWVFIVTLTYIISIFSWLTRQGVEESAFQCSDDVYDMKILPDAIICGLRNGTVEIWNKKTLKKELTLDDQQGSVQVIKRSKM